MPSSASTSLMMPRFLTKTSTKASCSALRRWKRPSWKRPSIWVSQLPQWSRVTASSSPQTGQRPMTGCSVTRKAPSFRRSSDATPAVEGTDLPPGWFDNLLLYIDFVNIDIDYGHPPLLFAFSQTRYWPIQGRDRQEASFGYPGN